jgi:hypothetical protein
MICSNVGNKLPFMPAMIARPLGLVLWLMSSGTNNWLGLILLMVLGLGLLPVVSATDGMASFPDVPFSVFSTFVGQNFGSDISLATVLTVVFSLTNNPDLLNLHARQQHPKVQGENAQAISGWMKYLTRALQAKLGSAGNTLLNRGKDYGVTRDQAITSISAKLDSLAKLMGLYPYQRYGQFKGKLLPISEEDTEGVHIICPGSMECETMSCRSRGILLKTRDRDVPLVKLIKGTRIYNYVPVLGGYCPTCSTVYYADHEQYSEMDNTSVARQQTVYVNTATYLKVAQNTWVDRSFSNAVLNATYSFHASASAFVDFWNDSFGSRDSKVTRREIWQSFVQESVRKVAAGSQVTLELPYRTPIGKVTGLAFEQLGGSGMVRSADGHACPECTHVFKKTADRITGDDPAAIIGVDENHVVPALVGEDAARAIQDAQRARQNAQRAGIERTRNAQLGIQPMDIDQDEGSPVKLVVMDGIVMGHKHCAFENCTGNLANAQRGVFCAVHVQQLDHLCRIRDCRNVKADGIQTCNQHRDRWHKHVVRYGRQSMLGIRRMMRRTEEEGQDWLPARPQQTQAHDEDATPARARDTYFMAPRFYCVETICAPCGVVIAWTKFARAESPTNILNFLQSVYPTEDSRPDYICIDKACQVLRTCVTNRSWDTWQKTTRFIVDSYHYINHRTTDYLCRKWCNPAPLNGTAPNLVNVETDINGVPHYTRAFNTQACEQLNAWLGGFQVVLDKMTGENFDWFLHTMLFLHSERVIRKQEEVMRKRARKENEEDTDSDDSSSEDSEDENIGIDIDRID